MRILAVFAAGAALVALAGCNSPQQTAPTAAPAGASPQARAPEGSGCAAAIARYRGVVDNDLAMGHVNQSVHSQIQGEVSEASSACAAGQEGRALSLLRASKSRHGYPG